MTAAPFSPRAHIVAGVFVGGASRRMSGRPKGLMIAPGGKTIVERTLRMLEACGVRDAVLVGSPEPYRALGFPAIDDRPIGVGPIGGLVSLLRRAAGGRALALACDMPFISIELLRDLVGAPAGPAVVAPRCEGVWQPLCARYEADRVLPVAERRVARGDLALQRLLDEVGAAELPLPEGRLVELQDWDTPEDVLASRAGSPAEED